MAGLVWGDVGQRHFETGIDRGVLYPRVGPGVAWNGLLSVNEKPTGGTPQPFYSDGYKYLNVSSAEEFAASIDALSAPPEFGVCDGSQSIRNGLFITQQRRESFGFAYRTKVGNDVEGLEYGYKIHLVYNALASASSKNYSSLSDSSNPISLSWDISTVPPNIIGYRPSAHFVIDSRYTPSALLIEVESILYGTSIFDPRLPSVTEIIELFDSYVPPGTGSFSVESDEVSGLWGLNPTSETGIEDVSTTVDDGIFAIPETSRLSEIESGFYILET
jgi:hypothetical protein